MRLSERLESQIVKIREQSSLLRSKMNAVIPQLEFQILQSQKNFYQFAETFAMQLNITRDAKEVKSRQVLFLQQQKNQTISWINLKKHLIDQQSKYNQEIKEFISTINSNKTINQRKEDNILVSENKMKQLCESAIPPEISSGKPKVKFQTVIPHSIKPGTILDERNRTIKITVQKYMDETRFDQPHYLTYEFKYINQSNRFVPIAQYPSAIGKLINDYNFHKDLARLQRELTEIVKKI